MHGIGPQTKKSQGLRHFYANSMNAVGCRRQLCTTKCDSVICCLCIAFTMLSNQTLALHLFLFSSASSGHLSVSTTCSAILTGLAEPQVSASCAENKMLLLSRKLDLFLRSYARVRPAVTLFVKFMQTCLIYLNQENVTITNTVRRLPVCNTSLLLIPISTICRLAT